MAEPASPQTDQPPVAPDEDTATAPSTDGRHQRGERTRTSIADALLDLLAEGELRPSSAQIAERAGVTQRTLFNQFGDMDSLVGTVADRQATRVAGLVPTAGEGPLEDRLERFTVGLAELLEASMNVRWAAIPFSRPDGPVARAVARGKAAIRARLADAFASELEHLDDEDRAQLLDALAVEADALVWRIRRVQQGQSVAEARAGVRLVMGALLHDATRRRGR